MSSAQIETLESLLSQGPLAVGDLKVALMRLSAEVTDRMAKGSSTSYDFFVGVVVVEGERILRLGAFVLDAFDLGKSGLHSGLPIVRLLGCESLLADGEGMFVVRCSVTFRLQTGPFAIESGTKHTCKLSRTAADLRRRIERPILANRTVIPGGVCWTYL